MVMLMVSHEAYHRLLGWLPLGPISCDHMTESTDARVANIKAALWQRLGAGQGYIEENT